MKRTATILAALLLAATQANAALRVPQVAVSGTSLQTYLNSVGESINVGTDQDATQSWSHTVSGTTTYTIQFQGSANSANHNIVMYNATPAVPPLFFLMSGANGVQSFCTATFKPGNLLTVNRFDALGNFLSTTTFGGVDPTNFSFALQAPGGTSWSQDARNGGSARALVFQGTGANAGTWWLCFDELVVGGPADGDFDDEVIMLESVNPTPVSKASWGSLKARFR